jgi:ABC-2 type transport system permease protein
MHSVFYMIEKELLQHKIVTRLPLFILGFSLLVIILSIYGLNAGNVEFSMNTLTYSDMFNVQQSFSTVISFVATLISILLSTTYLSKAICKDRQEGSLAFWRSMPISDLTTHMVKLGFALIIIPIICSILVLTTEFFLWFISLISPEQVQSIIGDISLFSVVNNYISFIYNISLLSFALIPLACLIFLISQLSDSPLLIAIIGIYALKIISSLILPDSGLDQFFYQFIQLPSSLVFSTEPIQVFSELAKFSTVIMYILAIIFFVLNLSIQKYGEFNMRNFLVK